MELSINDVTVQVAVTDDTPLLWVLRDHLGMTSTKFGCGMALCGACTVHSDGQPIRACLTPISTLTGKKITTIEGIGATTSGRAVQDAWLSLSVPQCGYCQSGQIMSAVALLDNNPNLAILTSMRR
jgi:isoquinoline 1-oxidoreductase subunit alpha